MNWPVLAVDIKLPDAEMTAELTFTRLKRLKQARSQTLRVTGGGWQTVYLSVKDFRLNKQVAPVQILKGVRGLAVEVEHAGDLFQAVAVENKSRWSYPRFGGGLGYTEEEKKAGVIKTKAGTVKIPENPPEPGHMTEFTEPINSRRVMAVTDEYVLVLGQVSAEKEHTYDLLYQFPGFRQFNKDAEIELLDRREKFDKSPLSAGQFVKDCQVYEGRGRSGQPLSRGTIPISGMPGRMLL